MRPAAIALIPILTGFPASAVPDSALLTRIRAHMREYLARLPDYTCRITLERSARPNTRTPFNIIDRLRLDVVYANTQEYYAWPGDRRFERNIAELLAGRGMVSEGSYALHMRKLFQTNDAEFGEPREADGRSIQVSFFVPSSRSGFAISAGGGSAPSALRGSVWFDRDNLDLIRLEVRVEDTPRTIRIESTREVTSYARARIGDDEFVLPAESELILRDRDGSERRNHTRYDEFHRYSASVTIHYGVGDTAQGEAPAPMGRMAPGKHVTTTLEAGIPADAAIGDLVTGSGGVTARITGLRRAGNRWSLELLLLRVGNNRAYGVVRKNVSLPIPAGATFSWRTD